MWDVLCGCVGRGMWDVVCGEVWDVRFGVYNNFE